MSPDEEITAEAFFMADHAAVENGKLYVNGGFWNQLQLPGYPATVTFAIATVLSIRWQPVSRSHRFRIFFIDVDGNQLPAEISGDFTVSPSPQVRDGDPTVMPISAVVNNFGLAGPGELSAVLMVDDSELARWSFRALVAPGAGPAPTPGGGAGSRGPISPTDLPDIFR